jgi:hypothetical protein
MVGLMIDIDDLSPITLTLALGDPTHVDRYVLEVRPGTSDTGAVSQRIPLAIPDEATARRWFDSQLRAAALTGAGALEESGTANLLRATVPATLVTATLRLLTTKTAGRVETSAASSPAGLSPAGRVPTAWVPTTFGPGIIENEATGHASAFERIELRGTSFDGWTRSARTAELRIIGGPEFPLRLLRPPVLPSDGSVTQHGDMRLHTAAGILRCRPVRPADLPIVSRVLHRYDMHSTFPLRLPAQAAASLLQVMARASREARHLDGSLDLDRFRGTARALEAFEVLTGLPRADAPVEGVIALRYRLRDEQGGAISRVFSVSDDGSNLGWLDEEFSLRRLAEQGWTPGSTRSIRPEVIIHFCPSPGDRTPIATLAELAEDGRTSWQDLPESARLATIQATSRLATWIADRAEHIEGEDPDHDPEDDHPGTAELWQQFVTLRDWITRCEADLDVAPPLGLDELVEQLTVVSTVEHLLGEDIDPDDWDL